jgi:hypothetical protein
MGNGKIDVDDGSDDFEWTAPVEVAKSRPVGQNRRVIAVLVVRLEISILA